MRKIYLAACLAIVAITFEMCTDEHENKPAERLTLVKTELGGCNIQNESMKSVETDLPDSVSFSVQNDTLGIFTGINFECCVTFGSKATFMKDTLIIEITDTCPGMDDCYCKCMCYYTFNFKFVDFEPKIYPYKVLLKSPLLNEPKVIKQGDLDLSSK